MNPVLLANQLKKENVVHSTMPEVLLSIIMYDNKITAVGCPLKDKIAGELCYHRGQWVICVNCGLSTIDRYITIAHLIYRYLAHRHRRQRFICPELPNISSEAELDAYIFAGELLNQDCCSAQMAAQLKVAEQEIPYTVKKQKYT